MKTRRAALIVVLAALAATVGAETVTVSGRDSAALKRALHDARPGDTVLLPAGPVYLNETLVLKTGVYLRGAGQGATVLRCQGEKPTIFVSLSGVEDVRLSDLTLDGADNPQALRGVSGYNAKRLRLERLTIRNLAAPGAIGIHFNGQAPTRREGVLDSLIADCVIQNIAPDNAWGAGVRCSWGSSGNTIRGCAIDNTGRGGIFGDNGSHALLIQGNTITRSHHEKLGIEVWGGCDRCVIEDNTLDHWLSIGGCDGCAVRRNQIACREADCYAGFGLEAIGSFLVITGNTVDGGQMLGLSVSGNCRKQYHYYADNTFRRCTQWGAQLQGEPAGFEYSYFYRCRFNDTTVGQGQIWFAGYEGHGFRLNGDTRYLVAEACDMSHNGRLGLQLGGARVEALSFARCTVQGNRGAAVEGPVDYTALEWQECRVEGNASNHLPAAKPFATAAPVAGFEVIGKPRAGQRLRFVSRARAAAGEIKRVLWDLGQGPALAGDQVRWTYDRPGTYTVTQIAWDTQGRANRHSQDLTVVP